MRCNILGFGCGGGGAALFATPPCDRPSIERDDESRTGFAIVEVASVIRIAKCMDHIRLMVCRISDSHVGGATEVFENSFDSRDMAVLGVLGKLGQVPG